MKGENMKCTKTNFEYSKILLMSYNTPTVISLNDKDITNVLHIPPQSSLQMAKTLS